MCCHSRIQVQQGLQGPDTPQKITNGFSLQDPITGQISALLSSDVGVLRRVHWEAASWDKNRGTVENTHTYDYSAERSPRPLSLQRRSVHHMSVSSSRQDILRKDGITVACSRPWQHQLACSEQRELSQACMWLMSIIPILERQRRGDQVYKASLSYKQVQGQPSLYETMTKNRKVNWRAWSHL